MLSLIMLASMFLISLAAGLLVPISILCIYNSLRFGVFLILFLFVTESLFPNMGAINFGVAIYLQDAIMTLILFACILRLFFQQGIIANNKYWFLFIVALIPPLALGVQQFGTLAIVSFRPYFYMLAAVTYPASFRFSIKDFQYILKYLAIAVVAIVLIVFARWAIVSIPITSLMPPEGRYGSPEGSILRVVPSFVAIVIAQFAMILFFSRGRLSEKIENLRPLTFILFFVVIVLQHRSVWLALLIGVAFAFLLNRDNQASSSAKSRMFPVLILLIVTFILLAVSGKFGGVTDDITSSASRAIAVSDTTEERLGSWKALLSMWYHDGVRTWIIGRPFGSDMDRYASDAFGARKITYQAHNFFIQTLMTSGLFGVMSIILAYFQTSKILIVDGRAGEYRSEYHLLYVLLMMQLIYYIPYGAHYMQGLLFGCFISFAAQKLKSSDADYKRHLTF